MLSFSSSIETQVTGGKGRRREDFGDGEWSVFSQRATNFGVINRYYFISESSSGYYETKTSRLTYTAEVN